MRTNAELKYGLRVGIARCDSQLAVHCAHELHKSPDREWLKRHLPFIVLENCYYAVWRIVFPDTPPAHRYHFWGADQNVMALVDLVANVCKMKDPLAIAIARKLTGAAPMTQEDIDAVPVGENGLPEIDESIFSALRAKLDEPLLTSDRELLCSALVVIKQRGLRIDLQDTSPPPHESRSLNRLPWYVYPRSTDVGARAIPVAAAIAGIPPSTLDVLFRLFEGNRIPADKITIGTGQETTDPYESIWWLPVQRKLLTTLFPGTPPREIVKRWNDEWMQLTRQEIENVLRSG